MVHNDSQKPNKWPRSHAKGQVLCHNPENYPKVPIEKIQHAVIQLAVTSRAKPSMRRWYFLILHTHNFNNCNILIISNKKYRRQ